MKPIQTMIYETHGHITGRSVKLKLVGEMEYVANNEKSQPDTVDASLRDNFLSAP